LRPFLLRRMKHNVEIQLPLKLEKLVRCKLSPLQQKYYRAVMEGKMEQTLSEQAIKQMKNRGSSIQNRTMQLRKVCNHPYLFEWPTDNQGNEIIDENIVDVSGKMQLLDILLPEIFKLKEKVLIFSQMTRILDILEDYMHLRGYKFVRFDGTTAHEERETLIQSYNNEKDILVFLLSTRSGGLGINLTAANHVIFYDNDWNPQMDLQAQDRAHRIGQKNTVKIYRLAISDSIESSMLQRASAKMKLEYLTIRHGNFVGVKAKSLFDSHSELESILKEQDIAKVGVAEDWDKNYLLDWSEEEKKKKAQLSMEINKKVKLI